MNNNKNTGFPNPLASSEEKKNPHYGVTFAKSMIAQWGGVDVEGGLYQQRYKEFEISRSYGYGNQDTSIYKQILSSLDPDAGDGSMVSLDWTPVPIIPKFVKTVVNKIISSYRYPQVEGVDPISQNERDIQKRKTKIRIENRDKIEEAKAAGLNVSMDPSALPQTPEEEEIFLDTNIKTDAEIAAQIGANATLVWNNFDERIFRRAVEDLVNCGMGVIKRSNDPNYGINEEYVDPAYFIHSFTEDPTFSDIVYGGHIKRISIQELKRLAGDQFTEDDYEKMARSVMNTHGNNASQFGDTYYDKRLDSYRYGYDEYTIEILDFEFLSVDNMVYEKKQSKHGNTGFYFKGEKYEAPKNSVYEREPMNMRNATVYGGQYIVGTEYIFDYGLRPNIPKNIHDISRARLSYAPVAVNMRNMIPKSMVSSVIGFADQIQLTHLKIQQAIAKAKPDGIIIDIESLENVDLGTGGALTPLDLHDAYEQTGAFYYRGKNIAGDQSNRPPIQTINNSIRNINELIALYNHYLNMIRDATGINEVIDGTTPKGEALVGVNQMAAAAGNNAIYDITNSSMILYRKVVEDIVKCLQILPPGSVIYNVYEKAIGKTNMKVLSSFKDLPMYNFGVTVVTDLNDMDRQYLEQNIQIALGKEQIDLEDAMAVRKVKDVDQAERLLVVRRRKRMAAQEAANMRNIQAQGEVNAQNQNAKIQGEIALANAKKDANIQEAMALAEIEVMKQIKLWEATGRQEIITKGEYSLEEQRIESGAKAQMEQEKEDRKDQRSEAEAVNQSKMISQREGKRGELTQEDELDI